MLKAHAETHLDMVLYHHQVLEVGTESLIVDPLHALQMNLLKVAFKYFFRDKMDDISREQAVKAGTPVVERATGGS
eukprot:3882224-Pleurochrysis_carterae.AAC.1